MGKGLRDKTLNYLDKVQQKRQSDLEIKKRQAEKQAAFKKSQANSETVVAAIAQQGAKSRQASEHLAKTDDVQQVVDSINKLNVTTFLASKDSWSQIVSDMASAAERIQAVMQNLDGGASKIDSSLTDAVDSLQTAVDKIKSVKVEADKDILAELKKQNELLSSIDFNPIVSVTTPDVKVTSPKVDLAGVERAIESLKEEPEVENEIDLACFKFHALKNDGDTFQYVGYMNTEGEWYIQQLDIEAGTSLYAFGKDNFYEALENRSALNYSPINEAYNAIKA
jgi:hypothetical protein